MPSRRLRLRQTLRSAPGWQGLVLLRSLAEGGERRQTAVARILRPDNMFQPHATTWPDRYPDEFAAVAGALTEPPRRILSFGCSSGDELLSLRRHFPTAQVHGIDVNPLAVRAARRQVRGDGAITVARSGDAAGEKPESYDVVLAMAVFRHGDLNHAPDRCDHVLHFADVERTVTGLSACVRPGGLLVIRHANFRFGDMEAAADYDPVVAGLPSRGAGGTPYPVYGRDDRLLPAASRDDGIYRKRG